MTATTEETTKRQMVEDDPAERELETDAGDAFEGAETGEQEKEDPEALFDAKKFDGPIALPKVDGEPVDKLALKFSGTQLLERSSIPNVQLMKRMKLGQTITFEVECEVVAKGHKYTTGRDGELDAVVLQHALKVIEVYEKTFEGE